MKISFTFSILLVLSCLQFSSCQDQLVTSNKEDGALNVSISGKRVFSYQYETVYPPEGIDTSFKRSGFIHPLMTLNGHSVTRIQPKDHYHHYGLWNPWTHTYYEGDTLDFWNLAKREGTVQFVKFDTIVTEPNFVSFKVQHKHLVLKDGKNKPALNETQTIKVSYGNESYYILDLQFDYTCASSSPFKIVEYRYGGLCLRGPEEWNNSNSEIINSEGLSGNDLDGSLARWCSVQGELGKDFGGVVMMSNADNYTYPEPLRVWPRDDNKGDVFINFSPTKFRDWTMMPGKVYTLKYRLIVFNDQMNSTESEDLWEKYSSLSSKK